MGEDGWGVVKIFFNLDTYEILERQGLNNHSYPNKLYNITYIETIPNQDSGLGLGVEWT